MAVLNTTELADLRTEIGAVMAEIMPDVCLIVRGTTRTRNPNAPDEFTDTPNAVYENVPCRYRLSSGRERLQVAKPETTELYTVTIPATIEPQTTDRIEISAKGSAPSLSLSVVSVLRKSNALAYQLICQK